MKKVFTILAVAASLLGAMAQGNLQFNRVFKVDNTLVTVPAGKVWKVTSVYGSQLVCYDNQFNNGSSFTSKFVNVSAFFVDGVEIVSSIRDNRGGTWNNTGCSSSATSTSYIQDISRPSDPNILPIWLAVNQTLRSSYPNVFLSVIEFNIMP